MSKNLSFLAFQTPYRDSPGGTVDRNAGDMGLIPGLGRFHMLLRETIPRQIDEKSRGPQGERGLEFSRRKKGQTFFSFSTLLRQQCILPENSLWIKPSG